MLIRFRVENFRSIDAPAELSMVAVDRDRAAARERLPLGESLVTRAGVYGPNASGKSSLVLALLWARDAVLHSLRGWEESIPVDQFAFSTAPDRATTFTLDLEADGTRYEYALEVTPTAVQYEALYEYPEKRARRVFEREGTELKVQRGAGQLASVRDLMTERTLVASLMRRFDIPAVTPLIRTLSTLQVHGVPLRRAASIRNFGGLSPADVFDADRNDVQLSLFDDESTPGFRERRHRAVALLKLADLGVDDVVYRDETVSFGNGEGRTRRTPSLLHRAGRRQLPLAFGDESAGTRAWFQLIPAVLDALDRGSVVVFDELDASLHPTLSAELLRLFEDRSTNPHGAQLIFTSHDTSLLNELNRDEVWLTEKGDDGSTRLGALSDFAGERVRTSQNLARGYLGGRFGALPDIDATDFLRTLGLIG